MAAHDVSVEFVKRWRDAGWAEDPHIARCSCGWSAGACRPTRAQAIQDAVDHLTAAHNETPAGTDTGRLC